MPAPPRDGQHLSMVGIRHRAAPPRDWSAFRYGLLHSVMANIEESHPSQKARRMGHRQRKRCRDASTRPQSRSSLGLAQHDRVKGILFAALKGRSSTERQSSPDLGNLMCESEQFRWVLLSRCTISRGFSEEFY